LRRILRANARPFKRGVVKNLVIAGTPTPIASSA
jgi:hypothetical protein